MGALNIALRAAQLVVDIAVLGLSAYWAYTITRPFCVDDFIGDVTCYHPQVPSLVSFFLFNTVWTLLVLIIVVLVPLCTQVVNPIAVAVLDGLTMIFWFSGAVAFAVGVGEASTLLGEEGVLAIPGAMTGLAFLMWLLFLASLIVNVRVAMTGRSNTSSYGAGEGQPYTGPTNFPPQGGQSPGVAASQGTYMQPMQQQVPMQQQQPSPMHTPAQQPVQPVQPQYPQQDGANADYYHQNPELAHA